MMLTLNQAFYSALFANMQEAFFMCAPVCDATGQPQDIYYLEANPAYCAFARCPREALVGHTHLELFPTNATFEACRPRYARVAQSGQPERFEQFAPLTGRYFDVLAYAPQPGQCAVLLTDITDRRQAEAALQASEDKYRALFETSLDAILLTVPDHGILAANPAACRMFGYTEEELISLGRGGIVDPQDPRLAPALAERAQTGRLTGELTFIRKGGVRFPGEVSDVVFKDKEGHLRTSLVIRDVSERARSEQDRQQMEATLRRSEAKFRAVVENSEDGILFLDAQGVVHYRSPSYTRINGFTNEERLGRNGFETMHPDDVEPLLRYWEDVVQHPGLSLKAEYRIIHKDGTCRWHETLAQNLLDNPHIQAIVAVSRDITERKAAEAALHASAEQYSAILRSALDGFWITDLQGRFLEVNDAACQILGYPREELLHMAVRDVEVQETAADVQRHIARMSETGADRFETRHRRKDGRVVDLEASIHYLRPAARLFVFVRDITERKVAEAALRLQSAIGAHIAEGVNLVRASDGVLIYTNPKLEAMFGYGPGELLGRPVSILNAPTREGSPADIAHEIIDTLLATGTWKGELENVRKDGTHFWSYASASQFEHLGSESVMLTVQLDISERKQAEAALRQLNTELEQRVAARTAELVQANRLKDEFLANMSHELRTPLASILGLAEVLEKGLHGQLNDEQASAVQMLRASGEHLLALINDILDLSKVEAGKMELELEAVEVEAVCQASLKFIQPAARKKNLRISFRHDFQVAIVTADSRHLKQMLVNLLSNAVKFTPGGGQVGLEVEGDAGAHEAHFIVWDTGIGIPPERQGDLFQPFVQLDGSLARRYEGTGLGLALVRSLAALHGGRVAVASAGVGQGARFTFTLPWPPEAAPEPPAPQAAPAAANSLLGSLAQPFGRPPVILAADDNPTTLLVLKSFLEALECQVVLAKDGTEALALAQTLQPDLLLLDIHMPGLDGLEVTGRLRAAGSTVPIVALTALAMPGDRERCLDAGADDYISKPMRLQDLTRVLARLLKLVVP